MATSGGAGAGGYGRGSFGGEDAHNGRGDCGGEAGSLLPPKNCGRENSTNQGKRYMCVGHRVSPPQSL